MPMFFSWLRKKIKDKEQPLSWGHREKYSNFMADTLLLNIQVLAGTNGEHCKRRSAWRVWNKNGSLSLSLSLAGLGLKRSDSAKCDPISEHHQRRDQDLTG